MAPVLRTVTVFWWENPVPGSSNVFSHHPMNAVPKRIQCILTRRPKKANIPWVVDSAIALDPMPVVGKRDMVSLKMAIRAALAEAMGAGVMITREAIDIIPDPPGKWR